MVDDRTIVFVSDLTGVTNLFAYDVETGVMKRLTEEFGGRKSTTLGAVIDEGRQQSLEICVIGTTDVSGKKYPSQARPAAHGSNSTVEELHAAAAILPEQRSKPDGQAAPDRQGESRPAHVHESKLSARKSKKKVEDQEEFSFYMEEEQRGIFDETERNLYDGEDLDVPTFLRQNVKVTLN